VSAAQGGGPLPSAGLAGAADQALAAVGVRRVPVPVPFVEAGGPANVYLIEEEGGGLALFDAGLGSAEGGAALRQGFAALGRSLSEVRRIFVSHGHVDHYGYARAAQEESGAAVFCHARDRDKLTWRDRSPERLQRFALYLHRLGAPEELLASVRDSAREIARYARPLEQVEELRAGERLRFARFDAEVLHLPGHTPGLVCLWDAEHALLFSDDHLLERVSPNPLLDLEEGPGEDGRSRHRALVEYLRSAARARALPAKLIAPGHGEPFPDHTEVIDRLLGFYARRQERILQLLNEGAKTAAELAPLVFPRAKPSQLYLVLSEVVGNLEVLEDRGEVARSERSGRWIFSPAAAFPR
jgi:glyoxylase-like metal-dependent hydrolase (beta-lactamase superfamily II)